MNLYIIRHAESRHNVGHSNEYACRSILEPYEKKDPSLSRKGRFEANLLGQRLSRIDFKCIMAGPMHRTIETAVEIARFQKNNKVIEVFQDLLESGVPDFTCLPKEILDSIYKDVTIIPPQDPNPTGGKVLYDDFENSDYESLRHRARLFIDYLAERFDNDDDILIVSHSKFAGRVLIPELLHSPKVNERTKTPILFILYNGSISKVVFDKETKVSRLIFTNDSNHNSLGHGYISVR